MERKVVMRERKIKLFAAEDVREFVKAAEKCDFDIDVFYNRIIIDAKSFLGVLSMDLRNILTVKYYGNNENFENLLHRYSIA